MDLARAKAHFEDGLYPESDEQAKWLIARVEKLEKQTRLTTEESWRFAECQEAIEQYKKGEKWYPTMLWQAEFLLELVERLSGQLQQEQ